MHMSLLGVYKHILEGLKVKLSTGTLRELDAALERITLYSRQSFFRIPAHTDGYFSGHATFKAFYHQAVMHVLPALLLTVKVDVCCRLVLYIVLALPDLSPPAPHSRPSSPCASFPPAPQTHLPFCLFPLCPSHPSSHFPASPLPLTPIFPRPPSPLLSSPLTLTPIGRPLPPSPVPLTPIPPFAPSSLPPSPMPLSPISPLPPSP
ncbi:unnamed protein product [Closterium sp. Naga37s-1]|nr:unnamed protein product [Closterium sp. Naga37s-1]